MEQESKSTNKKTSKQKDAIETIPLHRAIEIFNIDGLKKFSAMRIFAKEKEHSEKEWGSLFKQKRIVSK